MSAVTQNDLPQPSAQASGTTLDNSPTSGNRGKDPPSTPPGRRKSRGSHASSARKSSTGKGAEKDSRTKKRRKVTHACVYCQRSHMTCDQKRPCTRCVKRSIGHLCHDVPREGQKKPSQLEPERNTTTSESTAQPEAADTGTDALTPEQQQRVEPDVTTYVSSASLPEHATGSNPQLGHNAPPDTLGSLNQTYFPYDEWSASQDPWADLSNPFNSNYMFNSSELTNEYNLLNDFLNSSLFDDGLAQSDSNQPRASASEPCVFNNMATGMSNGAFAVSPAPSHSGLQMPLHPGTVTPRSANVSVEKAKEAYFLTAADPAGTAPPEERMNKLLQAKIDAGLLRPFNYAAQWATLNEWMAKNIHPTSRERINQQFNQFRPKFRERTENLKDIQLTQVEMWFERKLMEYDRIFASMAIPACCWRRTGGIHRGNREMAELLGIAQIEKLREGSIALHDIMTETSLVDYWERFTQIAFDSGKKAMLTECTLKLKESREGERQSKCCFSFTVVRDPHQIPALIVGNFLPVPHVVQEAH